LSQFLLCSPLTVAFAEIQVMRACPSVEDQQHALFNNSKGHNAVVFPWDGGNQRKIFLKVNITSGFWPPMPFAAVRLFLYL
jgi:hypothetical protein